ncbi:MAG: NUDIX hydrolase [Pseudoruegeria sp.]
MTHWRPAKSIRVKALGLHWRQGGLLAAEVLDDTGCVKGVRPLGGSVEFGETWQDALHREFMEELSVSIDTLGAPLVMENIYSHHGQTGHEVLFIAEVRFSETAFEHQNQITFYEDNGTRCTARWFDIDTLDTPKGLALFPTGLKQHLR